MCSSLGQWFSLQWHHMDCDRCVGALEPLACNFPHQGMAFTLKAREHLLSQSTQGQRALPGGEESMSFNGASHPSHPGVLALEHSFTRLFPCLNGPSFTHSLITPQQSALCRELMESQGSWSTDGWLVGTTDAAGKEGT